MPIFGQRETPDMNVRRDKSSGQGVSTSARGRLATPRVAPAVLFEDNHLIAIHKPAGWQSQPSDSHAPDALSWTKAYLKQKYSKPGNVFLGLVHRLDLPVAGVLVFARTSKGASRLSESIRSRAVEKRYLAWVENEWPEEAVVNRGENLSSWENWTAFLGVEAVPTIKVASEPFAGSVKAEMQVAVKERLADRTLVEIILGTGRKHQIRAMLAAQGYPILGDTRYGAGQSKTWSDEIALLAASLSFTHPTKAELVKVEAQTSEWMEQWRSFRL